MATTKKPDLRTKRASTERRSGKNAAVGARPLNARAGDEERYALALESIDHGVYDWDIVKGTVYYSPLLRWRSYGVGREPLSQPCS